LTDKRRGLGRGLGALIPTAPSPRMAGERPVDVFFPDRDAGFTGNHAGVTDGAEVDELAEPRAREIDGSQDDASQNADTPGEQAGEEHRAPDAGDGNPTQDLLPVPGAYFTELPVTEIIPNPRQPRQVFDEDAMAELVHSVREVGVLQPVVVRRAGSRDLESQQDDGARPRYELVMGERRWRAAQEAGLDVVPAIVRDTQDDVLLRDALLENLHRSDLNPLEEAAAYHQLLDDFGCTHDELALRIGRSRPQISNTLRLMKLPALVQRRVAAGVLSAGHARALLGLPDAAMMERLAQRIVAEGLSVRSTEEVVALGGNETAGDGQPRRPAHPGERHVALDELASRLSDRLDTRVTVALGKRKGKVTVEFASVDDLNRILGVLAPDEKALFRT
jgi:ParB family transcriptional regulator, chromosome partitioning protein